MRPLSSEFGTQKTVKAKLVLTLRHFSFDEVFPLRSEAVGYSKVTIHLPPSPISLLN